MAQYYHVTERAFLSQILMDGLAGGWGDDGFGVYVYDNLFSARAYAAKNGWDGELANPAILLLEEKEGRLDTITPNPGWPNPEDYLSVRVYRMEDLDGEEEKWRPAMTVIDFETPEIRP
ncbi:hypothetical protein ACEUZ9_000293 [Paracoccus litorisediminis]|uniref:hypothetical protein n=1 Tax=Paracoccus litorisediminis TaxID=2006130 RepID=UPI00373355AF